MSTEFHQVQAILAVGGRRSGAGPLLYFRAVPRGAMTLYVSISRELPRERALATRQGCPSPR